MSLRELRYGNKKWESFFLFFSLALTFLLLRSRREHCPNEMLVCSFAVTVIRQEGIHPSQLTSAIVRHSLARWLTLIPVLARCILFSSHSYFFRSLSIDPPVSISAMFTPPPQRPNSVHCDIGDPFFFFFFSNNLQVKEGRKYLIRVVRDTYIVHNSCALFCLWVHFWI